MVLSVLGFPDAELSITLVSDAAIAELGGRFGRPARPTDVLAFPLQEGVGAELSPDRLGDVVISIERAGAQAARGPAGLSLELQTLLVHSILHLLGMDHRYPAQARAMRALEGHLRWELARIS